MNETKQISILLVEDTEEHALLIKRGLEDGLPKQRLFRVKDGEEAIDFLFNKGGYEDTNEYAKPDIILLDLRLPKMSGIEVLQQIKGEERLKSIPVIVLTVSDRRDDMLKACGAGAQSYILKSTALAPKTLGMQGILDAIISLVR